jgi:cation:H+ antiporter
LIIGLSLVAIGTSLPELATAIVAALRKQNEIAVGNVVGSNIFNLLLVLGATSVIHPIAVDQRVINTDMLVALLFSVLLVPFARNQAVDRWEALLLFGGYITFTALLFLT